MNEPAPISRRALLSWVGLAARLVLGGVLLAAGLLKIGALGQSVNAVRGYQLLPWELTAPVGYALPIVEIAVGALLVIGLFTRVSAIIGSLLMVAFMIGIGSAWARGISIDCGCFGGGGEVAAELAIAAYPWEMLRDAGLLACGVFLALLPRTPLSLEDRLFPPLTTAETHETLETR